MMLFGDRELAALDRVRTFLKGFTSDGGCTEGPGYWLYGVSWFCAMAYYVHHATGGRIDLLADPMVPRVLEYPTKVVLSGDHVASFADCSPQLDFSSGPIQWAAEKVGVTEMVALASRGARRPSTDPLELMLAGEPRPFEPPREAWLPKLQVLTARGEGAEGQQLVLAAKGGHNAETHNHNDVGAFIVHWRGESLVCELGSGEYVRQMFSPRRYELFTTRSLGHDVPLVGGVEQATGRRHRASKVRCAIEEDRVVLSMDIAGAYPKEAGLASLVRTFEFPRGEEQWIELTDRVEFAARRRSYRLPLYTSGHFRRAGRGKVLAVGKNGTLAIEFDPKVLEARLEKVAHRDGRLAQRYGARLPRCMLSMRSRARSPIIRLRFVPKMP